MHLMTDTQMTTKEQSIERWLSQLSHIEFENQRSLADNSLRLIAEVRSRNLLTDDEWNQVKTFLKEALTFLSGTQNTAAHKADGSIVIDPDADPRNADWIRISAACRLARHSLPNWAALWLWWLRTDTSPSSGFQLAE